YSSIPIRIWTAVLPRCQATTHHPPKSSQPTGYRHNSKPRKPVTVKKNRDKRRMKRPSGLASELEPVPSSLAIGSRPKWMTWAESRRSDSCPTRELQNLKRDSRRPQEQESWRFLANRINLGNST